MLVRISIVHRSRAQVYLAVLGIYSLVSLFGYMLSPRQLEEALKESEKAKVGQHSEARAHLDGKPLFQMF